MSPHNSQLSGAERPVPPERRLRVMEVRKITPVTPNMRRITLASTALMSFPVRRPAQWVKLFVPTPEREKSSGRAYTIRHFREDLCEMDIDFVLHGDGPCSTWAENATPGDVVQIAGPRSGFRLDPDVSHLLIGGDETALPAIGSILEALPSRLKVTAFIEVPTEDDIQTIGTKADAHITWLPRVSPAMSGQTLQDRMLAATIPPNRSEVWFAAEAAVVRSVRRHFSLERKFDRHRISASGYWKKGEIDFRDQDAE